MSRQLCHEPADGFSSTALVGEDGMVRWFVVSRRCWDVGGESSVISDCEGVSAMALPHRWAASLRLAGASFLNPRSLTAKIRSETTRKELGLSASHQRLAAHRSGRAIAKTRSQSLMTGK